MYVEPAFTSFSEFLAMGKHGPYVWSIYGIGVAVYLGNLIVAKRGQSQMIRRIARNQRRQEIQQEAAKQTNLGTPNEDNSNASS